MKNSLNNYHTGITLLSPSCSEECIEHGGYYSPYELEMERTLLSQAEAGVERMRHVFTLAKSHCRSVELDQRMLRLNNLWFDLKETN